MSRGQRDLEAMPEVLMHTDGSCAPNPGPGGWCAVLQFGEHRREVLGGDLQTTNNRMELTAVIEGLLALSKPCRVIVVTDSTYVKDGIEKWLPIWRGKGWRTRAGSEVKNKDLWLQLSQGCDIHDVCWRWVRGHDGNEANERCDELAGAVCAALREDGEVGPKLLLELEQRAATHRAKRKTTAERVRAKQEQIAMAGHRRLDAEFDSRVAAQD